MLWTSAIKPAGSFRRCGSSKNDAMLPCGEYGTTEGQERGVYAVGGGRGGLGVR